MRAGTTTCHTGPIVSDSPKGPMQTALIDDSAPAYEAPDGRHNLRVVKLRLVLTLFAVAILPLAAVAPVIRSVLDDPRIAQHERLVSESEHAAAAIQRELTGIRLSLVSVGADPATVAALKPKAAAAPLKATTALLASVVGRDSDVVAGAALFAADGTERVSSGATSIDTLGTAPEPGQGEYSFLSASNGSPASIIVSVAIHGSGAAASGSIVASVPLASLLRWADDDLVAAQEHLAVVDGSGEPLAVITTLASSTAQAPMFQVSGGGSHAATGSAEITIPGTSGWHVVASAPLTVAAVPLAALVTLVALLGLILAATWWMGRKILEPAAELEAQRARFQGLYRSAREAALLDNLTGLGNHRAFQEAVTRMVDQSRRYGTHFSLILLDIDEFKQVNDTRGHAVGDELLAEVGNLIRSTVRTADAGFRIGGDEFAILLAETNAAGAEVTARRVLSRGLGERGTGRYKGSISFSAGVTGCPEFGNTRLELTAQADAALYRGKRAGRTIVTVFDPEVDRGHVDEGMRSELSAAVAAVIESGSLTPVYQPIVHLTSGQVLGYEGLVRVDPLSGFPHTGALFDAAEIAGRVLDLDRAALDVVLRGSGALPPEALLSLNVSPRSFEAPEFSATAFLAILRRHEMDPGRVLMELTERDAVRDPEGLRETVHTLQQAGVRVAADDVGAGNAGLRLLSQIRFDVVKIDLSLVQGGAGGDETLTILTSLVGLARRWGALTIAEGVETAAQLRMIRDLDVDAAQGYLLGRPGPIGTAMTVDLDSLAGPRPAGGTAARPPGAREPVSFAVTPARTINVIPTVAIPIPTAASVIAGERPSVFSTR